MNESGTQIYLSPGSNLERVGSEDSTDSDTHNSGQGSEDLKRKDSGIGYHKKLFRAAAKFINPGPFFRSIVYLYGERKLLVFFWIHLIATMTIWVHFGLVKFDEQKHIVPEGAPHYWWKRLAPPIEFGSMHAILFQMALIPLTMSRYSIAAMSGTMLDQFVPLNRALRIHIHLGYVLVSIVFLATVFFFTFFGVLCSGGEQDFCDKFTSEIMITGYCILGLLLIIGGTSYFRDRIPYEVFYVIHHLVFVMYAVTIVHTFDSVQRNNERNRSQTFKWFSSTILWYICDRMAMRLNHNYRARVVSAAAVRGNEGSRMLLIKVQRPVLFEFQPGQYAFLRHSSIDRHWHPFSIASSPSSRYLEFYVEVFGPETWTGKLWDRLRGGGSRARVELEIMGPYGTTLAKFENFSHGLVIGAGTGIVPLLSMFKQHVSNMVRLSPREYFQACEENNRLQMAHDLAHDSRKGSFARRLVNLWKTASHSDSSALRHGLTKTDFMQRSIRQSIGKLETGRAHKELDSKMLKWAAHEVTRSIYGTVLLAFLSVLGMTVLSLTISWNTIPIDLYPGMTTVLEWMTILFQTSFAVPAIFVFDGNNLFSFVDFSLCLVCIPADILWFEKYNQKGVLGSTDVVLFSLLVGYMTIRLWVRTVCPSSMNRRRHGGMKRLEVVWVSRSAPLISEILPDVNQLWDSVVEKWGIKDAQQVVRFSIYCTDKDASRVNQLKVDLSSGSLYQQGFVHFSRPKLDEILENQTLELIGESRTSNTLLAFCGSPKLAEIIHHCQVSNYMLAAVTGHKKHQTEFISESYGGTRKKPNNHHDSSGQSSVLPALLLSLSSSSPAPPPADAPSSPKRSPPHRRGDSHGRRVEFRLEDYSVLMDDDDEPSSNRESGVECQLKEKDYSALLNEPSSSRENDNDDEPKLLPPSSREEDDNDGNEPTMLLPPSSREEYDNDEPPTLLPHQEIL